MLYRKIAQDIESFLRNEPQKILLVNGARQIGKSFIIREVCRRMFPNYVELNLKEDQEGAQLFSQVATTNDFYLQLSVVAGAQLGERSDTIVFLDEIQAYPHLMTMLKFLNAEGRYRYIASGSQLGVALSQTASVPLGSIAIRQMYPLDFEEFLLAMNCSAEAIATMRDCFEREESLSEPLHNYMMQQFRTYLLVGGMPDAVNKFIATRNIVQVRQIQHDIHYLYRIDASQYDQQRRLVIRKVYDLIPSAMENRHKRIVISHIEQGRSHRQFADYLDEFEYLTNSGIALQVQAISNPKFPLIESEVKNLIKLYINDVGLLTAILYGTNIQPILRTEPSINLGSVYESVVAQELHAHGLSLHYYDNKQRGEVDFLIDDYNHLTVLPIEVKSGKDYTVHSALNAFVSTPDYHIHRAVVLSNEPQVQRRGNIVYMPIYYVMFFSKSTDTDCIIPPITLPSLR